MNKKSSKDTIRKELFNRFELAKILAGRDELDEDTYELFVDQIDQAANLIGQAVNSGGKVLTFGNGGSALQAAHITVELEGRFKKDRQAIPALCLNTDFAKITALGNDFGYPFVFVRQLEAHCKSGDVVLGLTTSDASESDVHSKNILEAFKVAKSKGAKRVGLFSAKTRYLLDWVDVAVIVPDTAVDLIQEVHAAIIHIICGLVEDNLAAEAT